MPDTSPLLNAVHFLPSKFTPFIFPLPFLIMKTIYTLSLNAPFASIRELLQNSIDATTYETYEEASDARHEIVDGALIYYADQAKVYGDCFDHPEVDNANYKTTLEAVAAHAFYHCLDAINIKKKQVNENDEIDNALSTL